ncbi:MAG: response regulator transcription factor [Chloroflexi bacterium]|nr:response regulator transcription factor [Chloroflexota bacterium]
MPGDKILVVDDEPSVTGLMKEVLEEAGYTVFAALDGLAGLRIFFQHQPDAAIVDIMMPRMDGWELCSRIREVSEMPIIILSARSQEMDKVRGLALGADDYLTKPVGNKELVARVESALRRARMPNVAEQRLIHSDGAITIDFSKREAHVRGKRITLTPLEYKLLCCLVRNPEQALTLDELLNKVWGPEYDSPEIIKWHIGHLRQKIEEDASNPKLIVTVRGVGYRYQSPAPGVSTVGHNQVV